MTVEQCIIAKTGPGQFAITDRVQLACEFVGAPDDLFATVRLLAAGAGLAEDDEITVPITKLAGI